MKKSQANQMFQMLMTLIVVGMILLLGFQLINNVMSTSSQIDYIRFRSSLLNSLDSVASDYNARQRVTLSVPRGTEFLCFVEMNKPFSETDHSVINAYWEDFDYIGQEEDDDKKSLVRNVFLIGNGFTASFRIDNLNLDRATNHICINVIRSQVEFWAKGEGRTLGIEEV